MKVPYDYEIVEKNPMEVETGTGGIDGKAQDVPFGQLVKAMMKKIGGRLVKGNFNFG